ncbi:MAG: hypothetical protein EBR02_09135 [Alphaproteobacteria bacterium]|nr:hypothetical protein [Alphaproteobacteria bacterium]
MSESKDVTLLTMAQAVGEQESYGEARGKKDPLLAMQVFGTATEMSDLAIVLGGSMVGEPTQPNLTSEGKRAGSVWLASEGKDAMAGMVFPNGCAYYAQPSNRHYGVRPALPPAFTKSITVNQSRSTEALARGEACFQKRLKSLGGMGRINIIEYGEYPQAIAGDYLDKAGLPEEAKKLREALEKEFTADKLKKTGKTYHFEGEDTKLDEYRYKDRRYIRVKAKHKERLSNGEAIEAGKPYWLEVQPIEWLQDKTDWWVAKKALFSGVQFHSVDEFNPRLGEGNFDAKGEDGRYVINMRRHLVERFAKEMRPMHQLVNDAPGLQVTDSKLMGNFFNGEVDGVSVQLSPFKSR